MDLGSAYVTVGARLGPLQRGLNAARTRMLRFMRTTEQDMQAWGSRFGRVASVARRAFLGLAAVFGGAAYAAAGQAEIDAKLGAAMRRIGSYTDAGYRDLIHFAEGMQIVTTETDDTVEAMLALGMNLGRLEGQELKRMTVAAMGLAQIINTDVTTSMMLLARAVQGQFQLFTRYGISLDETWSTQKKLNSLLEMGASGFEQVTVRAESLGGQLRQLKNAASDFAEALGFALVGGEQGVSIFTRLANVLRGVTHWISDEQNARWVRLAVTWGIVGTAAIALAASLAKLALAVALLKVMSGGPMALATIGTGLVAVGGLYLGAKHVAGQIEKAGEEVRKQQSEDVIDTLKGIERNTRGGAIMG